MSDTMKALAVTELGKRAAMLDMPVPRIADDQVLIRVHYSGVSIGTEMWIAHGKRSDYGDVPFVNGYQVTGEIAALGRDVEGHTEGDMVACFVSGAHSQYAVGRADYLHKLPDVSLAKTASLFVQPSVGANGLNMAGLNCGDTVVVIGQGLIGQAMAQLCRLRGAYVIATDVEPSRIEIARRYCADEVLNAGDGPIHKQIKSRFEWGVDMVVESTGFDRLIDDALQCCNNRGKFIFLGFCPGAATYTFAHAHTRQITTFYPCFIGSHASREGVLRLMASGMLQIDPLITHLTPWTEAETLYNQLFTEQRDTFNGIVFDWRA